MDIGKLYRISCRHFVAFGAYMESDGKTCVFEALGSRPDETLRALGARQQLILFTKDGKFFGYLDRDEKEEFDVRPATEEERQLAEDMEKTYRSLQGRFLM